MKAFLLVFSLATDLTRRLISAKLAGTELKATFAKWNIEASPGLTLE